MMILCLVMRVVLVIKFYTKLNVCKLNGNDSDQNASANDMPAYPTYLTLETGRHTFPP
jgi:hypothetical protein